MQGAAVLTFVLPVIYFCFNGILIHLFARWAGGDASDDPDDSGAQRDRETGPDKTACPLTPPSRP